MVHSYRGGKTLRLAYARVSTDAQELHRQLDALEKVGYDRIYTEKYTGTRKDRPELQKLLDNLREGDIVIIHSIDRLSRNVLDLLNIVEQIKKRGAYIKSVKDTWLDTTENSPMADFLITVMGALAQMERDLIVQRTKEGLESAKRRNVKLGRPELDEKIVQRALKLYDGGNHSIKEIIELTGISQGKLYKELKKRQIKG